MPGISERFSMCQNILLKNSQSYKQILISPSLCASLFPEKKERQLSKFCISDAQLRSDILQSAQGHTKHREWQYKMIVLCVLVYPDTPQYAMQHLMDFECYLSLHMLVTKWLLAFILQIVQNLSFGKGFLYNPVVFLVSQCFRMKIEQHSGRYYKTEIQAKFF